ncbi:DUF5700 domain-containing putative Zn-dependent protease [Larkinella terrae]|uniref:DUF2268 domain-containing protein n=1 Tax=Larkinella terrae TaxID=2025311 RepID=A0A7K0EQK5_9BACT|nr:DUF5700 domain-containing putative Zn-dependent protease [Larkinella terrae]MRS64084.1 hypothetical protein [Larkinella terrae]
MKSTFLLFAFIGLFCRQSFSREIQKPSPKSGIEIQLDFESAKAITALLTKPKTTDAELDRIAKLYGSQQLIKKVSGYDKTANETVFKQTLREITESGTVKGNDPFDWKAVKSQLSGIRQLINQLETKATFVEDVKNRILPYSPPNINGKVRACFLVGGGSLGFTLGNEDTFNVALQKIGDDYEGLVNLVAHELYHSVQQIGERNRQLEKSAAEPPKPVSNAYFLLANLWSEGTANLVGEFVKSKNPKEFSRQQQDDYARNGERARQNFALFESLLFSAFHDPAADMGELYNIAFTTAFDETSYYTGYRMAKVIEQYRGKEVLAGLINQDPIEFCRLYVAIYKQNPDKNLIRFSSSTEAILAKLDEWKGKL